MEVAPLKPFLESETLSYILTNIDSRFLNKELYLCKIVLKMSLDEVYDMPTFMRRDFLNYKQQDGQTTDDIFE